MNVVAIDPGKGGSVVHLSGGQIWVFGMPEDRCMAMEMFASIKAHNSQTPKVYIEKVAPFIPGGGASHMFAYGRKVEMITCVPCVLGFEVIEVAPQTWQRELGLGSSDRVKVPGPPRLSIPKGATSIMRRWLRRDHKLIVADFKEKNAEAIKAAERHNDVAKREWKRKLREVAQDTFPNFKVTLENCDALLILEYAKKVNELI